MLILSGLFCVIAKYKKIKTAPLETLLAYVAAYTAVSAALTLAYTIYWMIDYERTTGYSAGNGPLAWIFIYLPLSFTLGQFVGLIHWWQKKSI